MLDEQWKITFIQGPGGSVSKSLLAGQSHKAQNCLNVYQEFTLTERTLHTHTHVSNDVK